MQLARGVQVLSIVFVSWFLLGVAGVFVGVALAVGLCMEGPVKMSRHAAFASAGCFLAAGFATVVERTLVGEPRFDFAVGRPVASALGAVAGLLLVLAVLCGWFGALARTGGGSDCAEPSQPHRRTPDS